MIGMITINIKIPYYPRPIWESVIHKELSKHRFAVIVAHRRFGKTVGMVNQIIRNLLVNKKPSPQYAYIAPFRNQAKRIAWNYLKQYTNPIPGRKVNETELYVEIPPLKDYVGLVGGRIFIMGADNPESFRGMYWDGIVFDEYAQHPENLWSEVLRSSLMERKGWAYFIGTPKGQNRFYELYQQAVNDPEWYTCKYTVEDTHLIPEEELESVRKTMTDIEIRQELYCDFSASSGNVVITIDMVTEAAKRLLSEEDVVGAPVILGVDVARFGGDRTVIFKRQGLLLEKPKIFKNLDTMDVAARVANAIEEYNADITFVDAGAMGAGVIDRLRSLGYRKVIEVPFGGKATDSKRYGNLRAEMYFKGKEWILSGGALPTWDELEVLKSELTATEYKFSQDGRIMLEPKEKVAEKIGRSPDLADAMMLTFARPVNAKGYSAARNRHQVRDYNPLKRM